MTKRTIDFNKTLMKFLECSAMVKVSGKPTVRGIQCISRPSIWPISPKCGITSHLISTTNVCEVIAKRALLNYAIIQDIPFDVEQVIEDAILH